MLSSEQWPVLRNAPFIWVGHSVVRRPYRMVRLRSVHSHLVVSLAGEGRALIGGRLVKWSPGQVLLAPVGLHHAFEAAGPGPWRIAWVFFDDTEAAPALRGREVELRGARTEDFAGALDALTREASAGGQPAVMEALVTLLGVYARRLAGADEGDLRLWRLWTKVEKRLQDEWDLAGLARLACVSEEHLRRLCQRHYQHSPMEQLRQLRMRRAAMLLRSSEEGIEEIAQLSGYGSLYSFSTAFRRWCGVPPARFRRGEGRGTPAQGRAR